MRFVSKAMNDEANVSDFTGACYEDSIAEIALLLKSISWPEEGTDPLQWALRREDDSRSQIVKLLLDSGSPVDGQSLYLAGRYAPDLFSILPDPSISCVQDVRALDSALMDAARSERSDHIERLLKLGASAGAVDYFYGKVGWTMLHHICANCDAKSYQVVFPKYYTVDVNRVTNEFETPLSLLEKSKHAELRQEQAQLIRKDLLERMEKV